MRDAEGFESLEPPPGDLVRHERQGLALGQIAEREGFAVPFGGQPFVRDGLGEGGKLAGGERPADGDGCRNTVGHDKSPV
ncbi:hypothetical protein [Hankyongella ginsenosidimutans]|uniref:hypothetical protein n=1 Tax=Hankyongella ginsenosidimutans TaxID=1763828 RepID=UPI001CA37C07|nr:hypothetical protein [Hankyongella ginsenosidimutans]